MAAFSSSSRAGAWAFAAPALGIAGAGLGAGAGVEHFEVMAALEGIKSVLDIDQSRRPLRVHSDSQPALDFLHHASKHEVLPQRKTFARIQCLYDLAVDLAARRCILPVKVAATRPEHADCHRRAARTMRAALKADPALAWTLAFRKEEQRLEAVTKERTALQFRLEALEDEALLIGVRLAALNQSRPPDARDAVA